MLVRTLANADGSDTCCDFFSRCAAVLWNCLEFLAISATGAAARGTWLSSMRARNLRRARLRHGLHMWPDILEVRLVQRGLE